MRRRQIYAQPNRNAMAALPGTVAEAGQGSPSAPAPQGLTFEHDHRTKVTLPVNDLVLEDIKIGDVDARMNGLYRAIHVIQKQNPEGPLHINFAGEPVKMTYVGPEMKFDQPKNKGGRPKGSKNKAKN